MAFDVEKVYLSLAAGDSLLVRGDSGSRKELFCRLLLSQAVSAGKPVLVVSFNARAYREWFKQQFPKKTGLVVVEEPPESLTDLGILVSEAVRRGSGFVLFDFLDVLSVKEPPRKLTQAVLFNIQKLKGSGAVFVQSVNPSSFTEKEESVLESAFTYILDVRRFRSRNEFKLVRGPEGVADDWSSFGGFEGAGIAGEGIVSLCKQLLALELANAGLYARSVDFFDEKDKRVLTGLSEASLGHAKSLAKLIRELSPQKGVGTVKERVQVLEQGLLEERLMHERYASIVNELGRGRARILLKKIMREEESHERKVLGLMD